MFIGGTKFLRGVAERSRGGAHLPTPALKIEVRLEELTLF